MALITQSQEEPRSTNNQSQLTRRLHDVSHLLSGSFRVIAETSAGIQHLFLIVPQMIFISEPIYLPSGELTWKLEIISFDR